MQTITLDLTDCFGIQEMHQVIEFNNDNVVAVYARNGLMKTSFAKTMKKIQLGKIADICDAIFEDAGTANILIDGRPAQSSDFFVINSFESSYESDITSLLVKGRVKEHLKDTLKLRDKFFKILSDKSGLKLKKTTGGKAVYELENAIIDDFGFTERSILLNLEALANYEVAFSCPNIAYATIFDRTVLTKIKSAAFQEKIATFVMNVNHIYNAFPFMKKGEFTLPKLKDVKKAMEKDKFFVNDNQLLLFGQSSINSIDELQRNIEAVETEIKKIPALQEIASILSDAKGSSLLDEIELHPEIVEYLAIDKLPELRKMLWRSYIECASSVFAELRKKYEDLANDIDNLEIDDTPWKEALSIFEKRFSVPYQMGIENLKGAIIGESVPHVVFTFSKGNRKKRITRTRLDEIDTLSQGEKRALYLLNIIFDIEQIKDSLTDKLIVIDDIADSFDYKNKYAIIEYLYELAHNQHFYLLILSHNFDFYRTISSRLSVSRQNRLFADINNVEVILTQEHYQNNPFEQWKNNPSKKNAIAMIPFVRNLIKFGKDSNVSSTQSDFLFLTSLLHEKSDTNTINFGQLLNVYSHYVGVGAFRSDVTLTDIVVDELTSICDAISSTDILLENKVVLAIGIRHLAEKHMISTISAHTGNVTWKNRNVRRVDTAQVFLNDLNNMTNQTRELFAVYSQLGAEQKISILNEVNIMTPENIHLNSFMYEPILDMEINALIDLYIRVRGL